jgi:hypothetical protein
MCRGQSTDLPVWLEEVHRAPVGEPGHAQAHHAGQGGLVFKRRGELLARLGQEFQALALRLHLGPGGLKLLGALEDLGLELVHPRV